MTTAVKKIASRMISAFLPALYKKNEGKVIVLMYHRVGSPGIGDPTLRVDPGLFRKHMGILKDFDVLSMDRFLLHLKAEKPFPPRSVLVTFDDGYLDLKENAYPVMKELGIPGTVFIVPRFADSPDAMPWWDILHYALKKHRSIKTSKGTLSFNRIAEARRILKKLRRSEIDSILSFFSRETPRSKVFMDWKDLKACQDVFSYGSHTMTHVILPNEEADVASEELVLSRKTIARRLSSCRSLAYPDGGFVRETAVSAKKAGYEAAFTTRIGFVTTECDRMMIPRVYVAGDESPQDMPAKLAGIDVFLERFRWKSR